MLKTIIRNWKDALTNVMPHVEVRSRRVGGATFQIQINSSDRKISMAMKWFFIQEEETKKDQWLKD
jgi:small subunit ribosomal protein S7